MTGPAPASPSGYRLQIDSPDALAVSIVMSPQQSVVSLLWQAASGDSMGAPPRLLTAVGRALRPPARFAVRPFAARGSVSAPECCVPIPPVADLSVTEQARRLRDLPTEVLTDELQAGKGCFPPSWQIAAQQPRRWLNSMADASLDVWAAIEPYWRATGPLFDREVRRVGTAAVRAGLPVLLNNLHPNISYRDGTITLAVPRDVSYPLGRRRLALLPMIAGRDMLLVSFECDDVCYIGYPVQPPGPGPLAGANGTLALVLGPLRAAALRALRQPLNVGDVAAAVQCAPTTATYHLHRLAAAGLVTREQRGSAVLVTRTPRGDELIDLLAD